MRSLLNKLVALCLLFVASSASAADIAISALPAASSLNGSDVVPIVQSGTTKKASFTTQQTFWQSLFQPLDGDLTAIAALTGTHNIYYRSATNTWTSVTIGSGLDFTGATLSATAQAQSHTVSFAVDGNGVAISAGTYSWVKIPYGGTLTGWTLIGSPSGSITVDIIRATDTNGLPVSSIVGGGGTKPALSTAVENKSTSFTGWTSTTLNAFDNLAVTVSGVTSTTYCVLVLYYQ